MIPHVLLQKLSSRINWLGSRCLCDCHDKEERTVFVYVTLSMRLQTQSQLRVIAK
jgi:hypothetical protein